MRSPFRLAASRSGRADPARGGPPAVTGAALDLEPELELRVPDALEPELELEAPDALDAALDDLEAFPPDDESLQEIAEQTPYGEVLLEDLIRRQLRLGVRVAAVFLVILFGLPLMNLGFPELVQMRVLGLPMSWLALAMLIYPFVWLLAGYFVSTARKYEDEFTELIK